jgi:hypothetical protein
VHENEVSFSFGKLGRICLKIQSELSNSEPNILYIESPLAV